MCFWLDGVDDVVKGQIAHLDQDASNNKLGNLAFLCFNHHDEYDSTPNVSKGLQQQEVTQWRDELYKEMEYRFRSIKARRLELTIARFDPIDPSSTFRLEFRLQNVGDATITNAAISIRLPLNATAESPRKPSRRITMKHPLGGEIDLGHNFGDYEPMEMFGFDEAIEDFFEQNGRIAKHKMHPMNRGLLPDHTLEIRGLGFRCEDYPDGSELTLEYRVDADDMSPHVSKVSKLVPSGREWILQHPERYGLPSDITLEQLEKRLEAKKS